MADLSLNPVSPVESTARASLARKLALAFLTIGLVATLVTALLAYLISARSLRQSAFSQLQSLQTVLKDSIESYFRNARNDVASMADSLTVRSALHDLYQARRSLKADLQQHGARVDPAFLAQTRARVQQFYENVLLKNLAQVRGVSAGNATSYMHKDDEANLLQYMFTVENPAAVGSKFLNTSPADFAQYRDVDATFRAAFAKTDYAVKHAGYHALLTDHRVRQGYYDIFIVDAEGTVIYTNFKELDFQGNLRFGAEKDTGLGQAFVGAMALRRGAGPDSYVFQTDTAPYPKSYDAPAMFISAPIPNNQGETIGALIYQLPLDRINQVMTFNGRQQTVGLGDSGEAYLVGADALQRTDSRALASLPAANKKRVVRPDGKTVEDTTIGVLRADSTGVREALAGRAGVATYSNYRGEPVLGAFGKLDVPGLNWGITVEQNQGEAFAPARRLALWVLGAGLLLAALVGWAGYLFSRTVARPVEALDDAMKRVAAGDVDARAQVLSRDEIGRLAVTFNRMVEERNTVQDRILDENQKLQTNIRDLLGVVSDASEGLLSVRAKVTEGALGNVAAALNEMLEQFGELIQNAKQASARTASAASEIDSASKYLADGATRQTTQVGQTIENVRSLTDNARAVVESSNAASQAANQTRTAAEQGAGAVREVVAGMEKIRQTVQANAKKIKRLGDRTMEISGITRSISDIAVQTDMLALNAAMEATRAGEQGRNFGVVADQVRGLSDRAKQLTVEIERLVNGILSETAEAVQQMETQTQEVEAGARKVEVAGQALQNIVRASSQSSDLVAQISQRAHEQAHRAGTMLTSVANIKEVADVTQDRATTTRATSEQLAKLSTELDRQLARFNVAANGGAGQG